MLESPWSEIHALIEESGVGVHAQVYEDNLYLLEMQMMHCVLGLKRQELAKQHPGESVSAAEHYGLWAFYGVEGYSKFWASNHLDDVGVEPSSYYLEQPS